MRRAGQSPGSFCMCERSYIFSDMQLLYFVVGRHDHAQRFSGWVSRPLHRMDAGFFAFDKAAFKFAPRGVLMAREQAVFKTTQLSSFDVA